MPSVFVDTVAWIALINASDSLHRVAQNKLRELRQSRVGLWTSQFVLLEVADALSAPGLRTQTSAFINGLRHSPVLKIVPADDALWNSAWSLYVQRADKDWSLTDCSSF